MAITTPFNQPRYEAPKEVMFGTLAANTTVPAGTLAMNDAGVAKPFTTAGYLAGAAFLGAANQTYANPTGSTLSVDMMFARDTPVWLAGKGGDLPTAAEIGKPVALDDNFTCKKTIAANELTGVLLEIAGNRYRVALP